MKAVFDARPGSSYKDDVARCYHFPSRADYLAVAHAAVGDWIVYREPRRGGGRQGYIGVARVTHVEPDPADPAHHYAFVADYLPFPEVVPLESAGRYAEAPLRDLAASADAGRALQGKSLRPLLPHDFVAIVEQGLRETLAPANALRLGLDFPPPDLPPLRALPGLTEEAERRVEQLLVNRKIRDANFRLDVCRAYDDRCAVTGLRIVNGGGRAEVQAAHVKPVALGGPDIVQNGIALSATVHWLFDRHLISVDEDHRLLVAHNRVPGELRSLFRPEGEGLHLPGDRRLWPHPAFLGHHRERFAGAAD